MGASLSVPPRAVLLDFMYSIEYREPMLTIVRTPEFTDWLDGLKDRMTHARLVRRLEKAERGNLGDAVQVSEKVWEMREFFGPGWRMYYTRRGNVLIVMLGGGDKSTQSKDIARAIELAATLED